MKKPELPSVADLQRFLGSVRENLAIITGRRGKIQPLPEGATTDEVRAKVNEILSRLQD